MGGEHGEISSRRRNQRVRRIRCLKEKHTSAVHGCRRAPLRARLTKQPPDRRFQHEPLPPVSLLRPAPLLTAATSLSPVFPSLHSGVSSLFGSMLSEGVTLLKLLPSSQVDSAEQRFVLGERTLSGKLVAPPPCSPEPPDPPVPPDLLHSPLNRTSTHPSRPVRSMNTQLDRYILVEENVSRLVSLQHSANQSFEDWLLIVKVWVVICFVDVQPFLFTSGGLSTRFIYEIRRHRGVEAKLNQICLAGRVYCSTVLAAPCFSTAIHVDLLPTGNDNTTTASTSLRRSILESISIMCALQQRFSLTRLLRNGSPLDSVFTEPVMIKPITFIEYGLLTSHGNITSID
ncbi:hypothetical protein YC2023_031832 [Brassica napus]